MPPRRGVQGWREPVIEESTVWDRLVDKAFEITGNADEGDDQGGVSTLGLFSPRWEPSATIMYNDPYMGGAARPLEGVKVRVSTFINVGSGYTDANGNVRGLKGWGGKFRNAVQYKIIWENDGYRGYHWNIRNGRTGQAKTTGMNQKSHWSTTIDLASVSDRKSSAFAAVHIAMWDHYMKQNSITKCTQFRNLNVAVKWEDKYEGNGKPEGGHFTGAFLIPINLLNWGNAIVIWGKRSDGSWVDRRFLMTAMAHELGHASHWQSVINDPRYGRAEHFLFADDNVVESYANAVKHDFMLRNYGPISYDKGYDETYTGIGEALLTHGYTMAQLQSTVTGTKTWDEWKRKVKNLYVADNNLVDILFANATLEWGVDIRTCIEGQDFAFVNSPARFVITDRRIRGNGVTVTNWNIQGTEGVDFTRTTTTDRSATTITFLTTGTKKITVSLRFPNGSTYNVSRDIIVKANARLDYMIFGPYIGQFRDYRLGGSYGTVEWNVYEKVNLGLRLVNEEHHVVKKSNMTGSVIFYRGGNYVVKAQGRTSAGTLFDIAVKEETVPHLQGGTAIIRKVRGWYGSSPESKTQYSYQFDNVRPAWTAGYPTNWSVTTDPNVHFAVWTAVPESSHKHADKLIPVYRNVFGQSCAWDSYRYAGNSADSYLAFYISTARTEEGMVALYLVEKTKYVNEKKVYHYKYLTRENPASKRNVTSWVWNWLGTKKLRDKNWTETKNLGVKGYAFPYGDGDIR